MSVLDLFRRGDKVDIPGMVDQVFNTDKDVVRQILERIWFRNLLYYVGEQWIEWMRGTRSFRRKAVVTPTSTPVSNEIRDYVVSGKAMLLNQKFIPRVSPNTNERLDEAAAEVGTGLLQWMSTLFHNSFEDELEKTVIGMLLFGTVFMRSIPRKDAGLWFIQPNGDVRTTGDVWTECVLPFNTRVPDAGDALFKKRWVGVQTLREKEWVEDTFKVKLKGSENKGTIDYQRRLMTMVGQVSPWKGTGLDYYTTDDRGEDLVMLKEMEFEPTIKKPDGRYIATCTGTVLVDVDRMPVPVKRDKQQTSWYYTLTDFHFHFVPGRFWSDSGVDDLISPQNTINEIDKALADNRKQLGRTTVLTPSEVTMKKHSEAGDSVLVLRYDASSAMGARPVIQQGVPLPDQVIKERMIQKQGIQDRSGDPKNVLAGAAPSAHASGVMTDMLMETAERGHYPDINRFIRSLCGVQQVRLLIANELYTEQRIIKVMGVNNREKVVPFKAADLRNNTDVKMEPDEGLVTTKGGRRSVLLDLIKGGIFNPQMGVDPTMRYEILRRFGFSNFTDPTNIDVDRAQMENGYIMQGDVSTLTTVTVPIGMDSKLVVDDTLFKYDNHPVHFESHRRLILTPEFQELDPEVQAAAIIHTDYHNYKMRSEQAEADARTMMMAQGAGGQGGGMPQDGGAGQPPGMGGGPGGGMMGGMGGGGMGGELPQG